jgi:hypothetical protein
MTRTRAFLKWSAISYLALTALSTAFAATPSGPIDPAGFGDVIPVPDLAHGGSQTLFEHYGQGAFQMDSAFGFSDATDKVMYTLYSIPMLFLVWLVRGIIGLAYWLFTLTDIQSLQDSTSDIIKNSADASISWLFPSALAIGGLIAYVQNRGGKGAGLSQVSWVAVSAIFAVSFVAAPSVWVRGVGTVRTLGATAVVDGTSQAVSGNSTMPFDYPAPQYSGSDRDTLLRKAGDSIWRSFVVTPWCIADLGSVEACKYYGKDLLDKGTDMGARKQYIEQYIDERHGGAATKNWAEGHNPAGRFATIVIAMVIAVVFGVLVLTLAFAALMAVVLTYLLLIAGAFFAMLWVIPGQPRQWGVMWFNTLLGLVMQSIAAFLTFGAVLSLVTAVFSLTPALGWLPANALALTVCAAGFAFRRTLGTLTSAFMPHRSGSAMMGYMAMRSLTRTLRRGGGSVRPQLAQRSSDRPQMPRGGTSGASGDSYVSAGRPRKYRAAPPHTGYSARGGRQYIAGNENLSGRPFPAGPAVRPSAGPQQRPGRPGTARTAPQKRRPAQPHARPSASMRQGRSPAYPAAVAPEPATGHTTRPRRPMVAPGKDWRPKGERGGRPRLNEQDRKDEP